MALDATTLTVFPTAIIAVGGVLKLTYDALNKKDKLFIRHLESQELRQEKFLSDHMSATVAALKSVADRLVDLHQDNEKTADNLRMVRADLILADEKRDKNRLQEARDLAETLKAADEDVTRRVQEPNDPEEEE